MSEYRHTDPVQHLHLRVRQLWRPRVARMLAVGTGIRRDNLPYVIDVLLGHDAECPLEADLPSIHLPQNSNAV